MDQRMNVLWLEKYTNAWHRLDLAAQQKLFLAIRAAFDQAGGRRDILIPPIFGAEQWSNAGLENFPDSSSVEGYIQALRDLNWFHYVRSIIVVGYPFDEGVTEGQTPHR